MSYSRKEEAKKSRDASTAFHPRMQLIPLITKILTVAFLSYVILLQANKKSMR
jgi:hypothetical protein